MFLTDLPPELLRMILLTASTPSFVQLIRTCHTIYDFVEQSRDIIRHHLNNIPGETLAVSEGTKSTREVFLILRRRAAASLQGVNITADRHDFYIPNALVDVTASCISTTNGHDVALVQKNGSLVQLYEAFQGEVKLRGVLSSKSDDRIKYIPLKTTFDQMNNVYVLYSMEKNCKQPAHPKCSYFEPLGRATLTRVRLSAPSRLRESWEITRPRHRDSLRPDEFMKLIDLVAHGGEKVSMAWDSGLCVDHAKYALICVCTLFQDGESNIQGISKSWDHVNALMSNNPLPECYSYATSRIAFSSAGRALKCYSAGLGAPTIRIHPLKRAHSNNVTVNKMGLDLDDDTMQWFSIEDPFFGYHEIASNQTNANARTCRNIRLSFATATPAGQNQTIACILKSCKILPENHCPHTIHLDEPHAIASTEHIEIAARLWGFTLATTTMAGVMAFAEQGTRIAIANWDKIFVWALQPKALADAGKWTHRQIYQKTYDRNLKCHLVELKPIVLEASAVVHKMAFTANENKLITITDVGLKIWNLGPSAIGRRTVGLLHHEEDLRRYEAEKQETCVVQKQAAKIEGKSGRPPVTLTGSSTRTPAVDMMEVGPG